MTRLPVKVDKWLATKDAKYREEARSLLARLAAEAGKAEVNKYGIGFGHGSDGYPLIGLAVRKDGLRLYANTHTLARYKTALGRALTGKSCVTLKRSADIDGRLLKKIVAGSLAASAICEK